MTGLSRAQAARLITRYQRGGQVRPKAFRRRRRSPAIYTAAGAELLAQLAEAHETFTGPATNEV